MGALTREVRARCCGGNASEVSKLYDPVTEKFLRNIRAQQKTEFSGLEPCTCSRGRARLQRVRSCR